MGPHPAGRLPATRIRTDAPHEEANAMKLHATASKLPEDARARIGAACNAVLTDGVDLFTQTKVAHWNIKGPQFAALHPLFDSFAADIARCNDEIAERGLTLGVLAVGTARHAAKHSRLPDYPQDLTSDLEHVRLLADRFGGYLLGVRAARQVAEQAGDDDTVDLLTEVVQVFEKHAWFLHATLER
jgi:starvation-inducible DNA-binding protein